MPICCFLLYFHRVLHLKWSKFDLGSVHVMYDELKATLSWGSHKIIPKVCRLGWTMIPNGFIYTYKSSDCKQPRRKHGALQSSDSSDWRTDCGHSESVTANSASITAVVCHSGCMSESLWELWNHSDHIHSENSNSDSGTLEPRHKYFLKLIHLIPKNL